MEKKVIRDFKIGEDIYVVDNWGTNSGSRAIEAYAEIIKVDHEKQTFLAVLYGDTYKTYSFKDYGYLIFASQQEAIQVAYSLPNPNSFVWQIIGNNVCKKTVLDIYSRDINGITDLVMKLNGGEEISIKELGVTIFTNEPNASKS